VKPKKPSAAELSQFQLFHSRLDQLLHPHHELIQLAKLIDWNRFDEAYEVSLLRHVILQGNGAPGLPIPLRNLSTGRILRLFFLPRLDISGEREIIPTGGGSLLGFRP